MAKISLPLSSSSSTSSSCGQKYQLQEKHRQAILAGSDTGRQNIEIEEQRQNFILQHGGEDMPNICT